MPSAPPITKARRSEPEASPLQAASHADLPPAIVITPEFDPLLDEGAAASPGDTVATVTGPVRALLTGERVALNFLMHLSGIATHTRAVVAAAPGLRVVDTRKTTPLIRAPQRRAVRSGGGANHRFALYDGVLIKDNQRTAGIRTTLVSAAHLDTVPDQDAGIVAAGDAGTRGDGRSRDLQAG